MTMTKARKIALGLSLAAVAIAGGAYAAEQGMKGDGSITRAEAQARAEQVFARLDANHDGKLDQTDRIARRDAMFDRIDTNHDGQISRSEFEAAGQLGPEGDGKPEVGPGMHRWDGPGRHMGHGHHGDGMMMLMMGGMPDARHDGVITRAEFVAAAIRRFDQADTNHDGVVTKEERRAAFKAMREQMHERWQDRADTHGTPPAPAN